MKILKSEIEYQVSFEGSPFHEGIMVVVSHYYLGEAHKQVLLSEMASFNGDLIVDELVDEITSKENLVKYFVKNHGGTEEEYRGMSHETLLFKAGVG